jgi:hypothetical protein
MGADKILPEGQTRPMPQIHNQGFPHEFAIVTIDLPTLGTNTKNPKEKVKLKKQRT